jgi:HAE1 family hydrophobic/amphiphilic exporter-1
MYTSRRLVVLLLQDIVVVQLLKSFKKWLLKKLPRGYDDWAGISADEVSKGIKPFGYFLSVWVLCLFGFSSTIRKFYSALIRNSIITSGYIWCFPFAEVDRFRNNIYAQVAMVMLIGLLGKMPF